MNLRHSVFLSIVFSILLSFSLFSCGQEPPKSVEAKAINPNKNKDNEIEEKVSLDDLNSKIEKISSSYKETNTEINKINSKIEGIESMKFWVFLSLAISGLSLVLCIITLFKNTSIKDKIYRIESEFNRLRYKPDNYGNYQQPKANTPSEFKDLKRKVDDLSEKLNKLSSSIYHNNTNIKSIPEVPKLPSQHVKKGYFANPINGTTPYFKKLLQYKEPEARFSAEITNNKAVFKPFEERVDFNTYISFIDDFRTAIEFSGCDPKQATRMKIIEAGIAEFKDGNWYIIKKASVNLSK